MLKEQDARLWRVLGHSVEKAYRKEDWSGIKKILVDETSRKRSHGYVTVDPDARSRELLFLAEGKGKDPPETFAKEMREHKADPEETRSDLHGHKPIRHLRSPGKAGDPVHKEFGRQGMLPKGNLWALRGSEWTRSEEEKDLRRSLCATYPRLGTAIGLREALQEILSQDDPEDLHWWLPWADRSRLAPFRRLSKTIQGSPGGIAAFSKAGKGQLALLALPTQSSEEAFPRIESVSTKSKKA